MRPPPEAVPSQQGRAADREPFVLLVDKPVGPTSHDVVARARRAIGVRKIGHTGTLDPFASGLLILCVGTATRIAEYLSGLDKRYTATAKLGVRTATDDLQGATQTESDQWRRLTAEQVREAAERLVGPQRQRPPVYSAKKIDGRRAHELARRGETVDPEPVDVTVYALDVIRFDPPFVEFTVHCSSGTYVRALARDLGEALGVGAHLVQLRRDGIGRFRVDDALRAECFDDRASCAWLESRLSPASALAHLPSFELTAGAASEIRHGRPVDLPDPLNDATGAPVAALHGGRLVAVGVADCGRFQPRKVFAR